MMRNIGNLGGNGINRETAFMDFRQEFIEFAVAQEVLRFGEFKTKAGRLSPYFFNAGLFNDGAALGLLAEFYAKAITASGLAVSYTHLDVYKRQLLGFRLWPWSTGRSRNRWSAVRGR